MIKKENTNTRTGMEIAVIGMSGRFPGAKNIHEFWENLKNAVESIAFFSDEELEKAGIDPGTFKAPGYVKASGHLQGKELFDASFFGYSPLEAELMNPQICIFHECVWEALEDAGYNPEFYNERIGLYAGASSGFYWEALAHLTGKRSEFGGFASSLLINKDFLCSRVSYNLNLKGACSFVQTACSTSLVAIHQACRALLTGESEMVLAGGVSILSLWQQGYLYQEGLISSQDGHCRAFAGNSSGTIGGEGSGIVVLKRLKPALQDHDHIYAIIRGTSINNDGNRKVGFTAPSVEAQAAVIRTAQRMARVEPESITYIEAHGTGTSLGDPVEIEALKLAFKTEKRNYCGIGSVKSNFGHLDAAAGVAGLIKTALALKHKLIPPSLHIENTNPKIDFKNSPFYVNTTLKNWQSSGYPLRAGVNSFGIGGTNAHVILEEMPEHREKEQDENPKLILLSARTPAALEQMTANFGEYFKANHHQNLADTAYTLQVGRKAFQHRRMVICSQSQEATDTLLSPDSPKASTFSLPDEKEKYVIYMFPGQGAQYINMGLELYQKEPVFCEQMNRCFEILKPLLGYDIKEILYPGISVSDESSNRFNKSNRSYTSNETYKSHINQTEVAQPLLFAFEYALSKLVMKFGIKPAAMIGHSVGEYTAACLSGVLSLEEALEMVVLRGRLMQQMPPGSMLSVPLDEEALAPFLNEKFSIAAVNTSSSCVVSGATSALNNLAQQLKEKGYETRLLHTSHAFHSNMMDPVLGKFQEKVEQVKLNPPQIPYISNVTGEWAAAEVTDPTYWARQLRSTVRFYHGLSVLLKKENSIFVEIGPGKALSTFVRQHQDRKSTQLAVNLTRHPKESLPDNDYLLSKIGQLWLYGVSIDWEEFYTLQKRYRIGLPTYPFERKRYWLEGRPGKQLMENLQTPVPAKRGDIADWFYIPGWNRSQLLPPQQKGTGHLKWLIFTDNCGLGSGMVKQIEQENGEAIIVRQGQTFTKISKGEYIVSPESEIAYSALIEDLYGADRIPDRVVHLWSVTEPGKGKAAGSSAEMAEERELGFYSVLKLVQAFGKVVVNSDIRLGIVTNNMHEVTGEEKNLSPHKALILGAVKVIPQEYFNIKCFTVDILLPDARSWQEEQLIEQLLMEFKVKSSQLVIAYRHGYRWVQVFEPMRLDSASGNLKPGGVYLITGGLGGIGLVLAEHLAKSLKARLVLTSRTPLPGKDLRDNTGGKLRKIRELEQYGAKVMVLHADASNLQQMQKVIDRTLECFGQLNGVIHAAGVADYEGIIQQRKQEGNENVLSAKVRGTWILDSLLKDIAVDFVVLCSSISSILSPAGQVGYAAANAFQDAFAHYKNNWSRGGGQGNGKRNCRWVSVNWDAWQKVGMGVEAVTRQGRDPAVILAHGILPEEGIEAFQRIITRREGIQVAVSTIDLQARINHWSKFEIQQQSHKEPGKEAAVSRQGTGLTNPYLAPQSKVEEALIHIWETFFGIQPIGVLDDFFELGGDSLKIISIISRIHKEINVEIPIAEFFAKPTIKVLVEYIHHQEKSTYSSIEPVEKRDYYALSSTQKRLYILLQMDIENTAYHIREFIHLTEEPDIKKLEIAFGRLIHHHESLRTSFHMIKDEPVQRIHESVEFHIEFIEVKDKAVRPCTFDLSRVPLVRMVLFKCEKNQYHLVVDMPHIISDGVSQQILIRDFMVLYKGLSLPPLRIQYKDFSQWQNEEKQKENIIQQEAYWLKTFSGETPVLDLPLDHSRPMVQTFTGSRINFQIENEKIMALQGLAMREGVTLFMVLLMVYNILLSKIGCQEDIVLGTPVAGRRHENLQEIIGMFVNTLALRNYPQGEKSIGEFLKDVKENTLKAFENQDYPFEELVEKVLVNRDIARNPLFDVMFTQNVNGRDKERPSDTEVLDKTKNNAKPGNDENMYTTSKFDMTLTVAGGDEDLFFDFTYNTSLFKRESIERFIVYFKRIVAAVTTDKNMKLSQIEIMPEEERRHILYDFIGPEVDYPKDKTIHQLFVEQALRTPDKIALVWGIKQVYLTYRELNQISHQLANRMKAIDSGSIAAIITEPSVEMMTAILGVLKTGACYLPIAPDTPRERIRFLLEDSEARMVLTQASRAVDITFAGEILDLETGYSRKGDPEPGKAGDNAKPDDPLYMIYTSGTTGTPKGVLVTHQNMVNYTHWFAAEIHLTTEDKSVLTSSFAFDLGYTTIYPPLLTGAQLHILPKESYMLPESLLNYISRQGITYLKMTPSLFSPLMDSDYFSRETCWNLRLIVLGGEAINVNDVERAYRLCSHVQLMNHYGPTEVTIGCITQFIHRGELEFFKDRPTIGKPIFNTRVYILDRYLNVLPVGTTGELCLSGAGVAKGYFKREALTAEKFIRFQPIADEPPVRIYRTGDLGRWIPDGNIELLGRMDQQVKIRGYRIELGEIENRVLELEEIKEAVVLAMTNSAGIKYLCAYIVPRHGETLNMNTPRIKDYLSHSLPEYMIPTYIMKIDKIPLTPNGKVQRNSLPIPGIKPGSEYEAPHDNIQEKLIDIWSEILGTGAANQAIGINDDFFRLGGQSLNAVVMLSRVHKELDVKVPLAGVFKYPSIKGLARYIRGLARDRFASVKSVEKKEYYALSSAQKRLYILEQMAPDTTVYNMPRTISLQAPVDKEKIAVTFKKLIARHESLRTSFHKVKHEPVQKVHDEVGFDIQYNGEDFIRAFDLAQAPLLRARLTETGETGYLLMVDMHHIVSDGFSRTILERDFMALYADRTLPHLGIQYKDFSQWENEEKQKEKLKYQEAFWLKEFQGDIPTLNLSTDYPRPEVQGFEGSSMRFEIKSLDPQLIKDCAREHGVTVFMLMLAVTTILFARLSNQEDIVIGTPTAGRSHADLELIIGMFVNTLALRNYPAGEKTFKEFLSEVKSRTLEAFDNQGYQFEDLVEKLGLKRDRHNPLFDVMFACTDRLIDSTDDTDSTRPAVPAVEPQPEQNATGTAKFDLHINVTVSHTVQFFFEYSTQLFQQETIKSVASIFSEILSHVLDDNNVKIQDIDVTTTLADTELKEVQDELAGIEF